MLEIKDYIKENKLIIIVKPNHPKNEILGFDENRNALKIGIKEKPEDNKANIEIIKFFSKMTGKNVKILLGLKSKKKVLKFE
ncbi:MAG: DUF167 domain-containing protein [Candidatus Woesearchaeota archaeon]